MNVALVLRPQALSALWAAARLSTQAHHVARPISTCLECRHPHGMVGPFLVSSVCVESAAHVRAVEHRNRGPAGGRGVG